MQSLVKNIKNSNKDLFNSQKTISVIPKISQPNKILLKQLQLSKPPSHIFLHDFSDVQSLSAINQELYPFDKNLLNKNLQQRLFQLRSGNQNRQSIGINRKNHSNRLKNLRDFLLQESQRILFMSRTITLLLNQNQKLMFKRLLANKNIFTQKRQQGTIQKYIQNLKKLSNSLSQNTKFPYLCPQLNQTIVEKSSFQNNLSSYTNDYLTFNDNFQSSNILMVKQYEIEHNKNIYCICSRFDYQTISYGQWFYFSIKRNVNKYQQNRKQHQIQQETKLENQQCNILKSQYQKSLTKRKYKFVICNMTKRYSMLGSQMKISVCRNGVWGKQGQNIYYYETCFKRGKKQINQQNMSAEQRQNLSKYHQLYFALQFQLQLSQNEQIYVSYNQPYTVSRLSNLLDNFSKVFNQQQGNHKNPVISTCDQKSQVQKDYNKNVSSSPIKKQNDTKTPQPLIYYKRQTICQTSLKNLVQCVTFSMKKQAKQKIFKEDVTTNQEQQRKYIFILARAHPIQTAGSYVLQGILNSLFLYLQYKNNNNRKKQLHEYFMTQNKSQLFQNLFKKFIIKIVPMVNPDGVVLGNSRCNFHGYDLNRQWKKSDKILSSQIFHLKRFLLRYKDRIQMVIDLHGHSKKKNVFAYGMHDFRDPFSTREFPYILSKLSSQNFLFQQCRFTRLTDLKYSAKNQANQTKNKKQNSKEGTARIWLFRKLSIPNIFTIQNSYCGSMYSKFHYDTTSYRNIGKQILVGISLYFIGFKSASGKQFSRSKSKKKHHVQEKIFKQDESQQFQSKILSFDQLQSYKDSIMLDLKSKQQNISMGMEQIDSSESEEQNRIEQLILQNKWNNIMDQTNISPSKSQSYKAFKKSSEDTSTNSILKRKRYTTKQNQDGTQQKVHNFNRGEQKIQHRSARESDLKSSRMKQDKNYKKIGNRYIPQQIKSKLKQISLQKRQSQNHKSTAELQKNVTLSIVQLGWDNNKIMAQNRQKNSQRYCPTDRSHSQFINYSPHNISNIHNQMINHHEPFNYNLQSKINEKLKNKMSLINSLGQMRNVEKKSVNQSNSNNQITAEIFQKIQQRKNVSQFMKKIESNRKIQNDYVTSKKIQKYKQIIIKINGNKNNYLQEK